MKVFPFDFIWFGLQFPEDDCWILLLAGGISTIPVVGENILLQFVIKATTIAVMAAITAGQSTSAKALFEEDLDVISKSPVRQEATGLL